MRIPKRDLIATGLVAAAALIYLLWLVGVPGMTSTRAAGLVILACGFAASASAVVPAFEQLLHGNKAYLVLTSLIGVLALLGGAAVFLAASETGLTVVMAAMVVLWAIATVHHLLLARPSHARETPHTSRPGPQPAALSH
jgi:hypothetical protein